MKTVIIGGGAAGMLCAYFCAKNGEQTILIEKNEKLGKKLYITGKGRCNLTNDCSVEEFLSCVVTNPRFLTSALYSFSPDDVMNFFEGLGLTLKTERGNRVFPASDKSSDVIKCLEVALRGEGVTVKLNEKVLAVIANDGKISGVKTQNGLYECDKVVICTGGASYPLTGSTGDGYTFAKSLGHSITSIRPALCGLYLEGGDFASLAGLTLKNIAFYVHKDGKEIYRDFGELLFTHQGISGPVVISASSYISKAGEGEYLVSIDLKPALDEKTLDARILRDFSTYSNKALKNSLGDLLPRSLISEIISYSGLDGDKSNSIITSQDRKKLLSTLKNLRYKVKGLYPLDEAIVTGGGVNVKEINPKTMQSKLIEGLYFAGEVIDVDALTGGFNLQCAFATAYLAGNSSK